MWYIYKYQLPRLGETAILEIPEKLNICDINIQGDNLFMWASVDITSPLVKRTITVIGTGWEIDNPDSIQFLRTVHWPDGCVWHVLAVHEVPHLKIDENALKDPNSDSTLALNDEASNAA